MARRAKSLEVLGNEVHVISPSTVIYDEGDDEHKEHDSDHNANAAGVWCAIDIMPGHGLDLQELSESIRRRRHPAGKYVIFEDQIASAARNWEWRDYAGDWHDHVHVSAGVGADGHSTGPYDNTEPWNVGVDMLPAQGYIQHFNNYLTAGLVALTDTITIPEYKNGGQVWAKKTIPNVLAVTLKARTNPDVDESVLATLLATALTPILEDILEPGEHTGITAEQAKAVIEDALNRSKITVS